MADRKRTAEAIERFPLRQLRGGDGELRPQGDEADDFHRDGLAAMTRLREQETCPVRIRDCSAAMRGNGLGQCRRQPRGKPCEGAQPVNCGARRRDWRQTGRWGGLWHWDSVFWHESHFRVSSPQNGNERATVRPGQSQGGYPVEAHVLQFPQGGGQPRRIQTGCRQASNAPPNPVTSRAG